MLFTKYSFQVLQVIKCVGDFVGGCSQGDGGCAGIWMVESGVDSEGEKRVVYECGID